MDVERAYVPRKVLEVPLDGRQEGLVPHKVFEVPLGGRREGLRAS